MNELMQDIVDNWLYQQEQSFLSYPAQSEPEDNEPLDFSEGNNND